jgi:hypothetical protein
MVIDGKYRFVCVDLNKLPESRRQQSDHKNCGRHENGLDGIVMIAENEFIISNYQGTVYYIKADGTKQLLLDTRANRIMSNDVVQQQTKTLYVPRLERIVSSPIK